MGLNLAGAAPPGAEALDLASFRRRDVVRTASHLAHEPLLLHLAAELPKSLFELLRILDDYSHNRTRIPIVKAALLCICEGLPQHCAGRFMTTLRIYTGQGESRRVGTALVHPSDRDPFAGLVPKQNSVQGVE